MWTLKAYVFPRTEISFRSKYSVVDCVSRLLGRVNEGNFGSLVGRTVLGTVTPEKVILRHRRMGFADVMVFTGSFSELEGGTILSGTFEVPRIIRVFLTCCLLGVIFLFGYTLIFTENTSAMLAFGAIPAFLLLFWLANVYLIHVWGHRDIEYLSNLIKDTLS